MKIKILLLLACSLLAACSGIQSKKDTKTFNAEEFPQTWKLQSFSTMRANSETVGEAMPYQEIYIFKEDGKFEKIRIEEGATVKATGSYEISLEAPGEHFFVLKFSTGLELAESCTGGNTEQLLIASNSQIRGTANACDHPSKIYNRIE